MWMCVTMNLSVTLSSAFQLTDMERFPSAPHSVPLHLLFVSVCSYDTAWAELPWSFDVPKGGARLHSRESKQHGETERPCAAWSCSYPQSVAVWTVFF